MNHFVLICHFDPIYYIIRIEIIYLMCEDFLIFFLLVIAATIVLDTMIVKINIKIAVTHVLYWMWINYIVEEDVVYLFTTHYGYGIFEMKDNFFNNECYLLRSS